jgi:hypothetical protein
MSTALAGGFLVLVSIGPARSQEAPQQSSNQPQVYEPSFFARFAPKTAADMVGNIPGFSITSGSDDRGFGQARQNVLINGRRVSGKANDARTALGRITAESVVRIEIVDGATLDIPGLSGGARVPREPAAVLVSRRGHRQWQGGRLVVVARAQRIRIPQRRRRAGHHHRRLGRGGRYSS